MLSSCGGKKKNKDTSSEKTSFKVAQTSIKGSLGNYFEVVQKDYKISKDGMFSLITVEFKRNSKKLPFKISQTEPFGVSSGKKYHIGFGIQFLDGENNPVAIVNPTASGLSGVYNPDDITNVISLKAGETGYIRWAVNDDNIMKSGVKFCVTSAIEKDGSNYSDSSSNQNSDTQSGSLSTNSQDEEDWDAILDSYEDYTNQCAEMTKKLMNGDQSVLSEYSAAMDDAKDLESKLKGAAIQRGISRLHSVTGMGIPMVSGN